MQEHCCDWDKAANRNPKSIGDILADSQNNFGLWLAHVDAKLAEIKSCPAPCVDGIVTIKLQRGEVSYERRAHCPILNPSCAYGAVLQKQIDQRLSELLVAKIGVPRRHVARFDRYFETIATKEAACWGTHGFLALSGKTGCGKSFGAAWFIAKYLKDRIGAPHKSEAREWHMRAECTASGVVWSTAQSIVDDKDISAQAKPCPLLVLDDLGKECELQSALAVMRDLIAKRYDDELPTIITTELTVPDIDARYGRAIAERIIGEAEDGGRFIACGDTSLRLVKG